MQPSFATWNLTPFLSLSCHAVCNILLKHCHVENSYPILRNVRRVCVLDLGIYICIMYMFRHFRISKWHVALLIRVFACVRIAFCRAYTWNPAEIIPFYENLPESYFTAIKQAIILHNTFEKLYFYYECLISQSILHATRKAMKEVTWLSYV